MILLINIASCVRSLVYVRKLNKIIFIFKISCGCTGSKLKFYILAITAYFINT